MTLATQYRLPAIFDNAGFMNEGALMSYSPDFAAGHRRAAVYVDKLLKCARASDLPIEAAMTFVFAINVTTARSIGLTIPGAVLRQATEVIQR